MPQEARAPAKDRGTLIRSSELSKMLAEKGVRVAPGAGPELRFVTHRHIGDAEIDQALRAFADIWAEVNRA